MTPEEWHDMEQSQPEKLIAKVCCYVMRGIAPKGIAVFDDATEEKFCLFWDEETQQMIIQRSDTVAYDLVECDVVRKSQIN